MLAVLLEVLVVIAILMIISVLRTILMHLLGTRSKLVWSTIATHGHCFKSVKLRGYGSKGTHFVQVVAEDT